MSEVTLIETLTSDDGALQSEIYANPVRGGYLVKYRDVESGEYFDLIYHFSDLDYGRSYYAEPFVTGRKPAKR